MADRADRDQQQYEPGPHQRDPHTGLLTTAGLCNALAETVCSADRRAEPWSVVRLRIESWAAITQRHGEGLALRVVQTCAQALREQLRSYDVPARIGDAEFAVALPNTNASDAQVTAQRLLIFVPRRVRRGCGHVALDLTARVASAHCQPLTGPELLALSAAGTLIREYGELPELPVLRGKIRELSVASLLGLLQREQKTGTLVLEQPERSVHIALRSGQVCGMWPHPAEQVDLRAALGTLQSWRSGVFEFRADTAVPDHGGGENTTSPPPSVTQEPLP